MRFASRVDLRSLLTKIHHRLARRRRTNRTASLALDRVERLESRQLLDVTLFNQARHLIELKSNGVADAAPINVLVNGTSAGSGDQLVISYDVDSGSAFDFRQRVVLDTNGFMRVKHTDSDVAAGSEDKFGTSIKLPPGIIVAGPQYFLTSKVEQIDLQTDQADAGILKLHMFGRPANGPGSSNPTTLPVSIEWTLTIQAPTVNTFLADLRTSVLFEQQATLSFTELVNGEAFRVAEFSSSNVPANRTTLNVRTHDADQFRILSKAGIIVNTVDLNAAATNTLLPVPPTPTGSNPTTGNCLELDQLSPAPLNQDPPNVSLEVLADNATYRGRAFVTVDATTDENSDNVGAWLARDFVSTSIQAGTRIEWTVRIGAADYQADPNQFTNRVYRAYNRAADDHFFTTSAAEFTYVVNNGLQDETTGQVTFAVANTQIEGTLALHRLYNRVNGAHYYTVNDTERDRLVGFGWTYEKDEGFLFAAPTLNSREIFRMYNKISGHHLFTEDASIKDSLLTRFPGVWVQHNSLGWAFPFVPAVTQNPVAAPALTAISARSVSSSADASTPMIEFPADLESGLQRPQFSPSGSNTAELLAGLLGHGTAADADWLLDLDRATIDAREAFSVQPEDLARMSISDDVLVIDMVWSDLSRDGVGLDQLLQAVLSTHL